MLALVILKGSVPGNPVCQNLLLFKPTDSGPPHPPSSSESGGCSVACRGHVSQNASKWPLWAKNSCFWFGGKPELTFLCPDKVCPESSEALGPGGPLLCRFRTHRFPLKFWVCRYCRPTCTKFASFIFIYNFEYIIIPISMLILWAAVSTASQKYVQVTPAILGRLSSAVWSPELPPQSPSLFATAFKTLSYYSFQHSCPCSWSPSLAHLARRIKKAFQCGEEGIQTPCNLGYLAWCSQWDSVSA